MKPEFDKLSSSSSLLHDYVKRERRKGHRSKNNFCVLHSKNMNFMEFYFLLEWLMWRRLNGWMDGCFIFFFGWYLLISFFFVWLWIWFIIWKIPAHWQKKTDNKRIFSFFFLQKEWWWMCVNSIDLTWSYENFQTNRKDSFLSSLLDFLLCFFSS